MSKEKKTESRNNTAVPLAFGLENSRVSEDDRSANSTGSQGLENAHRVPEPKGPPHHTKGDLILKGLSRKSQSYKVESVSGGLTTDMHNFSLESKRETEYVSIDSHAEDSGSC